MNFPCRIVTIGMIVTANVTWSSAEEFGSLVATRAAFLENRETLATLPPPVFTSVGVASCATTSCHGGPQGANHSMSSFSYATWMAGDRHAKAYEVLFEPRSVQMANLLNLNPPHRERLCLNCHSMQSHHEEELSRVILADGVGCESCHGDAGVWRDRHYLAEWNSYSKSIKSSFGFRDLSNPLNRATTCVDCHIGASGREVNHDLIAAGHPRLIFEYSAYQRLQPAHWNTRRTVEARPDFDARSWAVGQAVSSAAAASTLARRAAFAIEAEHEGQTARWPELAEFDCYACHHDLQPRSWRQNAIWNDQVGRSRAIGQPLWNEWQMAGSRLLLGSLPVVGEKDLVKLQRDLDALTEATRQAWPVGKSLPQIERLARDLSAKWTTYAKILNRAPYRTKSAGLPSATQPVNWESATQFYLMSIALEARSSRGGPLDSGTMSLLEELRFPKHYASPRDYHPRRAEHQVHPQGKLRNDE